MTGTRLLCAQFHADNTFGPVMALETPNFANVLTGVGCDDGGTCLVVWGREGGLSGARIGQDGRILDQPALALSRAQPGNNEGAVLFDGTRYTVIWPAAPARAARVHKDGTVGTELSLIDYTHSSGLPFAGAALAADLDGGDVVVVVNLRAVRITADDRVVSIAEIVNPLYDDDGSALGCVASGCSLVFERTMFVSSSRTEGHLFVAHLAPGATLWDGPPVGL